MTYSIDLRKRVVAFVRQGGSKAEASRRYEISLWCVNDWCKRGDLTPKTLDDKDRSLSERNLVCESSDEIDSKKKLLDTVNANTNYELYF